MVDWSKPIQFENGERCELVETRAIGYVQFPPRPDGKFPTRMIHRLDQDESTTGGMMAAYWFMCEDGASSWPGYNVVNVPEASDGKEGPEAEKRAV